MKFAIMTLALLPVLAGVPATWRRPPRGLRQAGGRNRLSK